MPRKPKKTEQVSRPSVVVLEAFGDPDDHLRLSTLIADVVSKIPAITPLLRGKARRLTDDRGPLSWRERRLDFTEIMRLVPSGALVLRDPDAFAEAYTSDGSTDWNDAALHRERGEFFECLMEPIARGAIELVRTAPDPRFSRRLPSPAVSAEDTPDDSSDPYASLVGPDARGALRWLLKSKHLEEDAVDELIEGGVGPALDRHFLLVTYDHAAPNIRAAAYRLAVLRGERKLNGSIGPFSVQARPAEAAVTRAQIDGLLACGFLRRVTGERVRMPRIVRDIVLARADATDPDSVADDHKLAFAHLEQFYDLSRIDCMIERHHHAVHGLLIKEAIATAKFYATDLRELAIRLSHKEQWNAAAGVYRAIVERDRADSYAWEYLGYNLVRAQPQAQPTKHVDEILDAYSKAHEIEPTNPLYHGRLVGFRGRMGKDIGAEFDRGIRNYTWNGVDRFASEVLKGLRRGKHDQTARRLVNAHTSLLKHPEVKRIMDGAWGRSPD